MYRCSASIDKQKIQNEMKFKVFIITYKFINGYITIETENNFIFCVIKLYELLLILYG